MSTFFLEHAMNSVVEISPTTRYCSADVDSKRALINITRTGTYGELQLFWKSGRDKDIYKQLDKGSIIPTQNQLLLAHKQKYTSIAVQVCARF